MKSNSRHVMPITFAVLAACSGNKIEVGNVDNDAGMDSAGTPQQCEYQGGMVNAGETVPAGDGCNTCTCDPAYGHVICTRSVCTQDGGAKDTAEAWCLYQGRLYPEGKARPDACNCFCDGNTGQFVCTDILCTNDGGSSSGNGGSGGGSTDTACPFVAMPKPITLGTVLGAGKSPSTGTIYVVDHVDGIWRAFVSGSDGGQPDSHQILKRQRISGQGSTPDYMVLTTNGPDAIVTIQIDTPAGPKRMGVYQGSLKDRKSLVIGQDGEELTMLADSAVATIPLRNLSGAVTTEYVASTDDGNFILVTRPTDDWTYSDFRVFFGPATAMVERGVIKVTRFLDGGSTQITFGLEGSTVAASFPVVFADGGFAPGPASLSIGSQTLPLTRLSAPPANATYTCIIP